MKVLLSFVLFFFIAAEIQAQVASTSLYITLSDIQSVRIVELPSQSKAVFSEKKPGKGKITILNPSASQVRKFESLTEIDESEYQQDNLGIQKEIPSVMYSGSGNNMQMANNSQGAKRGIPLVVYQIDPR
jgi:hypothetical protein